MIRIIKVFILLILLNFFSFLFCPKVLAVTITINNFPAEINSLDNFQVAATISGAVNATNYLRVDLYKDGSSNYFGETFNGNDWYSGGDGKSYLPIVIQNATASATIFAQIGNPSSNQYPGPGPYKLKIRRYTSSGSASSNDTQTPVDIQINYIVPTPTSLPSPTPIPSQASTPFPTPTSFQKTPTPSPTPTKSPSPKPTPTPTNAVLGESTESGIMDDIKGLTNFFRTASPTGSPRSNTTENKFPVVAIGFVGTGSVLIGISGILAYKKQKRNTDIIDG